MNKEENISCNNNNNNNNNGKITNKSGKSALRESIAVKQDMSYYYAHSKEFEIPANAIKVCGPGLITGGLPQLIEKTDAPCTYERRSFPIKNYSWADDGQKVCVFVPLSSLSGVKGAPLGSNKDTRDADSHIKCIFEGRGLVLTVNGESDMYCLKLLCLNNEINIIESGCRYSSKRITITLKKKIDLTWYSLTKK
eukprot:GHVR01190844.1.p1 GENE.GHVR01190844.1~~GHVR01190844.1.p1  ORF type:complete len:218 (+),score=55.69 GHVR01190844.1:72-656(+)